MVYGGGDGGDGGDGDGGGGGGDDDGGNDNGYNRRWPLIIPVTHIPSTWSAPVYTPPRSVAFEAHGSSVPTPPWPALQNRIIPYSAHPACGSVRAVCVYRLEGGYSSWWHMYM